MFVFRDYVWEGGGVEVSVWYGIKWFFKPVNFSFLSKWLISSFSIKIALQNARQAGFVEYLQEELLNSQIYSEELGKICIIIFNVELIKVDWDYF